MAVINFYDASNYSRLSSLALIGEPLVTASESGFSFKGASEGSIVHVLGSNITYVAGSAATGVVSYIIELDYGQPSFDLRTYDLNINQLIGLNLQQQIEKVLSGNNYIYDNSYQIHSDFLKGGSGNDHVFSSSGNDTIDGGAGDDTVHFSFASTASALTTSNGTTTLLAPGVWDTLIEVEHIAFSDRTFDLGTTDVSFAQSLFGTVTFMTGSIGGQVYALYDGILGRSPDTLGLEYWADAFSDAVAPRTLAAGILSSPEGQARAGAADNATFVTQLYNATLHRNPDAAGLSYWSDQLAHGTSRADVGVGFALSPEHLANIKPALEAGLFVPDADASAVARIYYTMLSRAPDAAGLKFWTDAIKAGTPLTAETQSFLDLPEAQAKVAGLTTVQYVDLVYTNALGRHAEADGLAFWTNAIDGHVASRVDVTTQIGQSTEAQIHLAPLIEQGWHLA